VGRAAAVRQRHGGNLPTVPDAVAQLRYEGRDAAWTGCVVPGGDAHAGRTGDGDPARARPGRRPPEAAEPGNTAPLRELLPSWLRGGTAAVSPNGVLGDPAGPPPPRARSSWRR
jgi:creatinine amidohydrolase